MAENSKIEWTDHTANFWWGCVKVSPGCQHCYAETFSKRVGRNIWGPAATTERWRTVGPWRDILKWDKAAAAEGVRKRVFAQSMSDFFEDHPQLESWRAEACVILEGLKWLDIQLLTKRPENIKRMVPPHWLEQWPSHIWIGTSVENQSVADERIGHLMYVPAAVRFLSCEPLLGPLLLSGYLSMRDFHGIDWVIVGGESGHNARYMDMNWAKSIVAQCRAADVPVFVKQLGTRVAQLCEHRDRKGGDINEWPSALRIREFPRMEAQAHADPHTN